MSKYEIYVEGFAKQYRIGEREPYRALRDACARALVVPLRLWRERYQNQGSSRRLRFSVSSPPSLGYKP